MNATTTVEKKEVQKTSTPRENGRGGSFSSERRGGDRGAGAPHGRRSRNRTPRERVQSEFDQRILSIRRVARVVAGGRRFSFSVALVCGNKKGSVGVGIGKASDTTLAIEKAFRNAKKNLITIPLTKEKSIPHEARAKYCSSVIFLSPVRGSGMVAGSSVRTTLELAGVTGVTAKILSRSKNRLNNARATLKALQSLSS